MNEMKKTFQLVLSLEKEKEFTNLNLQINLSKCFSVFKKLIVKYILNVITFNINKMYTIIGNLTMSIYKTEETGKIKLNFELKIWNLIFIIYCDRSNIF